MADYAIHEETLTGISNVIRKKDGTSALIDPADYADRINLMGMLEEKTVSGSIAHITDGADDVPIKSLVANLPASLTSYEEVKIKHIGKNLIETPTFDAISLCFDFGKDITVNNIVFSFVANGTISATNTAALIDYRKEDGTHGYKTLAAFYDDNNVRWENNAPQNGRFSNVSQNVTFRYIYVYYTTSRLGYSAFNADNITNWQVEIGNVVSDFEPYTAPTTHTASLGRTIYGGTVDVVAGSGENTEKGKWLSELTWTQNASYPHIFNGEGFTDRKKNFNWDNTTCLSDRYTGYTSSSIVTQSSGIALGTGATSTRIYVSDDRFETVADFVASLQTDDSFVVLPLENPETFTFTPITPTPETALGVNNFWSDSGDSEVTYRGQGTVTVYPNTEEASF